MKVHYFKKILLLSSGNLIYFKLIKTKCFIGLAPRVLNLLWGKKNLEKLKADRQGFREGNPFPVKKDFVPI